MGCRKLLILISMEKFCKTNKNHRGKVKKLKMEKRSLKTAVKTKTKPNIEINPLSASPTKRSNTLTQFVGNLLTNCLSVFDHFVKLEVNTDFIDFTLNELDFVAIKLVHDTDHQYVTTV